MSENYLYGENPIIETKCGSVRGQKEGGFYSFKGITYGQCERFMPPMPVTWSGIADCTSFGKKAMQVIDMRMPWAKEQPREDFDEDCLNLNIYIPEGPAPRGGFPVLLEVHGGAFQNGSNQEHTPEMMIRNRTFIYVSVNYRLGVLGFLYLGALLGEKYQTSGNNGLMDLMLSIKWVYENISVFSGNPEKMTVLGGSAGAKSIGALMLTPEFNRYVRQVILSSGATQSVRSIETSVITTDGFMSTAETVLEKPITAKDLLTLSADEILQVQQIFCDNPGNTCMFGPVADGKFIPISWEKIAVDGTLWQGNAMVGCSRHELGFYELMNPDFANTAPAIARALFGKNANIALKDFDDFCASYTKIHDSVPEDKHKVSEWVRIITDYMYRMYTYKLADRLSKNHSKVWQYSVEFAPALHCFDQMLAWAEPDPMFFKEDSQIQLARAMGQKIFEAFAAFVENGDPQIKGWEPLSKDCHCQMYFDNESVVKQIPEGDVLDHFPECVYKL